MNWQNRADFAIAQGALTNSKRPSTFIRGVYPTHARGGKGAFLYASDGKKYLDYYGALGSNLLGYGNEQVAKAVYERFLSGATLSLSSEIEVELAEKLKGLFLFPELWKFGKNGSDVCNAALKIARAYTGRDLVLSEGYHGIGDDFISLTPPALGVPKRDWMGGLEWERIKDAAAVIVEPVILDRSLERKAFLERLRKECTKHGTVLIFDEIITGFRFPKYSVSNYFGVHPDLILIGKAMGGGLPLSAIGGSKDLMNCGDYFYSGTFFGETVSMAACLKTIEIIHRDGSNYSMQRLWDEGSKFLDAFNALDASVKIEGYPSRGAFVGDAHKKALFWQECIKAGVLFGPSWFFNIPLAEYTDQVMPIFRDIFMRINNGEVSLRGAMPSKPFAQIAREVANGRAVEKVDREERASERHETISR